MELNAETRSVNEIFSPAKKYIVPRFQRAYSWGDEEIDEFWEDIVQQIKVVNGKIKNDEYFIGCIVLVGEDTKPDYLIVDGQQRMTTLTILLRCIINRFSELNDNKASDALYQNVIEGTDNDGNKYFKLINETPKPYFQNELQVLMPEKVTKPTTQEEKLLQSAHARFTKKINLLQYKGLSDLQTIKALRNQVLDYLKFILVTAKDEDDASTIFETLNARGLGLTSVDLIKNWIFKNYSQTHPNDNAKDIWHKIGMKVSTFSDLGTFFRHYWNSKYSFASNDRLYKSFKDCLNKGKVASAKEFLLELDQAATLYRKIGAPIETDWPVQKEHAVGQALKLINQYKVTQVRPFLLALLEAREKGLITQSIFIKVVLNLETFHFVFSNLCQDRASGLEGTYTRSAKNIHAAGKNKEEVKNVIKDLIKSLTKKTPSAQRITDSLKKMTFTKTFDTNKKTIQLIFRKIEQHLQGTKELQPANFSLEHIVDQSGKFSWCGNIGNLIPFSEELNNRMKSGKTFKEKKVQYKKSSLKIVQCFLETNLQETWTEEDSTKWAAQLGQLLCDATVLKNI
jgi:uncharacterized protein with ParB-like and HNH nuclease domain